MESSGQHRSTAIGPSAPQPGWYGHPEDPPRVARWWDGHGWTRTTRSCLSPLAPPVVDLDPASDAFGGEFPAAPVRVDRPGLAS